MTTRRKILLFIPLGIIAVSLVYSWLLFLTGTRIPRISSYIGLILFLPIIFFLFRDQTFKTSLVLTGIYLILGTINLLSFFPFFVTSQIMVRLGEAEIWSPNFNALIFVILILYSFLNFDSLVDARLDYRESKGRL